MFSAVCMLDCSRLVTWPHPAAGPAALAAGALGTGRELSLKGRGRQRQGCACAKKPNGRRVGGAWGMRHGMRGGQTTRRRLAGWEALAQLPRVRAMHGVPLLNHIL